MLCCTALPTQQVDGVGSALPAQDGQVEPKVVGAAAKPVHTHQGRPGGAGVQEADAVAAPGPAALCNPRPHLYLLHVTRVVQMPRPTTECTRARAMTAASLPFRTPGGEYQANTGTHLPLTSAGAGGHGAVKLPP